MINRTAIDTLPHKNINFINKVNNIVSKYFDKPDKTYFKYDVDEYREILVSAQNKLNSIKLVQQTVKAVKDELFILLDTDKILVQQIAYLRATRPVSSKLDEFIRFHRESFFGPGMDKCFNLWTPIKGVSKLNSINYIPLSHRIPLEKIKLKKVESKITKRYSAGHKLGLLYKDMIITKGVDLNKKTPLVVDKGNTAIFACNLIHGSAINKSKNIRFSYDFRIIRKKDYNKKYFKTKNFASNSDYFIEFN
tara:strand:+ start:628 stop:1377 length:750 start_codon:yes stop_codon:yes gene_type:complete